MSFRSVIDGAGLTLQACASTIGVDLEIFQEWADGKREMPPVYANTLAAVLGLKPEVLSSKALTMARGTGKSEPSAIWFKFRGEAFTDADRESMLLVRRLGHNANQLERATLGQPNLFWSVIFQSIRENVDYTAPPQEQGRKAAQLFSSLTQLGHGGKGCAEYLRGILRAKGILLIESSIPHSKVEGCSFSVGDVTNQRPCIFVNTFKSTWFRRNVVILHELGHALFDQSAGVEIDILTKADSGDTVDLPNKDRLEEVRAEAFARECLLPKKLVLSFLSQEGLSINKLSCKSLAALVSFSGVEKKTVVEILREYELIDATLAKQYLGYDIAADLRELNDHALSTKEFIDKIGMKAAASWLNKRFTTVSPRKLLLPVSYVQAVIEAVRSFSVNIGKAADLLMIDIETFNERFPEVVSEVSE